MRLGGYGHHLGSAYYGWQLAWQENMRNPRQLKKKWLSITPSRLENLRKAGIVVMVASFGGIVAGFLIFSYGVPFGLGILVPSIICAIAGFVMMQTADNMVPDVNDAKKDMALEDEINRMMFRDDYRAMHAGGGKLLYEPPSFGIVCPHCDSTIGTLRADGIASCGSCGQMFLPGHKI